MDAIQTIQELIGHDYTVISLKPWPVVGQEPKTINVMTIQANKRIVQEDINKLKLLIEPLQLELGVDQYFINNYKEEHVIERSPASL